MKKKVLLLLTVFYLSANVYPLTVLEKEKKATQVTLHGVTAKQPRSGIKSAISCYYFNAQLYVDFYEYVEDVNISVTNVATGDQISYRSEASSIISFDVPSDSGDYYVEIK